MKNRNSIVNNRNLFEIENARNLTRIELVKTFVSTPFFERLFSAKNHILLGSRGSGKTSLIKMLSFDHLRLLNNPEAKRIVKEKSFIGIYIPTKTRWVGALKNKSWQNEEENESFFLWQLNISCCIAFLETLKGLLDEYTEDEGQKARYERLILSKLSLSWTNEEVEYKTIKEFHNYLEDLVFKKHQQLAKKRAIGNLRDDEVVGYSFDTDLFIILERGIREAKNYFKLPDYTTWFICIDEAELLSPLHHRILNSYIRSYSENIFFKITTQPYCHYTNETNTNVTLEEGHDFEYLYIDYHYFQNLGETYFVNEVFNKRVNVSNIGLKSVTLKQLLGESKLFNSKPWDFSNESDDMVRFEKFASSKTKTRGYLMIQNGKFNEFNDQIGRKIKELLILKQTFSELSNKKPDLYSGFRIAIYCGDKNPRRIVRIINKFIISQKLERIANSKKIPIIPATDQNTILTSISLSYINSARSEDRNGPMLYDFIIKLGKFFEDNIHRNELVTEQISSFEIDDTIDDMTWEVIKKGVGIGLLYPNVNYSNPDIMPIKEGIFHFSYILAPYFKILPRKGDSRKLKTLLLTRKLNKNLDTDYFQTSMFDNIKFD